MESVVANGCSVEQPPEASYGPKHLRHQAALFIKLYETKEARLRDLLSEIQVIGVHVSKCNTKSKWSFYTGLISAAIAVGAGLAIPIAGGVGFVITLALTSVTAGGAVFGFKIKQFRTEEEGLKRVKQFLKIVNRLEHDLDELIKLCDSVQGGCEKAQPHNIPRLKNSLVTLFQSTDKLRAAGGVNELMAQCHTVFSLMEDVRRQLEEFRGGTEAGDTHPELVVISEVKKTTETSAQVSANEKRLADAGRTESEDAQSGSDASFPQQQQGT